MKLLDRIDANDTKLKTPNGFDSISSIKVSLARTHSRERGEKEEMWETEINKICAGAIKLPHHFL